MQASFLRLAIHHASETHKGNHSLASESGHVGVTVGQGSTCTDHRFASSIHVLLMPRVLFNMSWQCATTVSVEIGVGQYLVYVLCVGEYVGGNGGARGGGCTSR